MKRSVRPVDQMKSTSRKDLEDGAPPARVHGIRANRDPEYDAMAMTLEEWKNLNDN